MLIRQYFTLIFLGAQELAPQFVEWDGLGSANFNKSGVRP